MEIENKEKVVDTQHSLLKTLILIADKQENRSMEPALLFVVSGL